MTDKIKCSRCLNEIKKKEKVIGLTDFSSFPDKKEREEYYHKSCFEEILRPRNFAMNILSRASKLLDKAEVMSDG